METDENDVLLYYEPEEIEANRQNQNKDQFAELVRMKTVSKELPRNKFNIMEFLPKPLVVEPVIKTGKNKRVGSRLEVADEQDL